MIAGFVDPSFGINCLRGSDVWYLNQGFGRDGAANDNGHPTQLPSSSKWEFKVTYFYNLAQRGVRVARLYGHDPQAYQVMMARGWEAVSQDMLETLDAAQSFGIRCILTLGGLSDVNTWQQAKKLLDVNSQEFYNFKVFMARVADQLSGHPALELLEALNEADFMNVITGHWLKEFPAGGMQLLRGYAQWQTALLDGVRALQKRPGTPLGMGTAMDGTLFCDSRGNAAMPWGTDQCIKEIIPLMGAGCDIWTPHVYLMEDNPTHLKVFAEQKLPSFIKAAKLAGKQLVLGEAGGLYRGGIWTPQLQTVFDAYPDLVVCWMIRSWDPKIWTRPSIPARVPYSYSPAPTETITEPPVEEPSIPSDPAQEPPEEPSGEQPNEETPEDEGPAYEAPDEHPPEADGPEGADDGETSDPGEAVPLPAEPSPETGPRVGPGFVLWRVVEWILEAWSKMTRKWKR